MSGTVQDRVLRFIADPGSEPFDELALAVFRHQHATNPAYRRWCEDAGVAPSAVAAPAAIPAVPVAAFRELEFVCGTPTAEFRTSGTGGPGRGRHLVPSVEPYRAGSVKWFGRCVMPEGWKLPTLLLAPPPRLRPFSSLSRMLEWVAEAFGEGGAGWYVGAAGLERERLAEALLNATRGGGPVLVAGTSAALLAFLDWCDDTGVRMILPAGSRLMDTGGQKGTGAADPLSALEFQRRLYGRTTDTLGIPRGRCVNEYGMTELSSQAYDSTLVDPGEGRDLEAVKLVPPWARVTVVDPVTLRPLSPGESGLLRVLDLANCGSVTAVLTEDFGREAPGGFILEGRPWAVEARGCGLTFEELQVRAGEP